MPFRSAMLATPGIVEPVNKNSNPPTVTSGMVGQKTICGIASAGAKVLGTIPGCTVPFDARARCCRRQRRAPGIPRSRDRRIPPRNLPSSRKRDGSRDRSVEHAVRVRVVVLVERWISVGDSGSGNPPQSRIANFAGPMECMIDGSLNPSGGSGSSPIGTPPIRVMAMTCPSSTAP